MWGWSKSGRYNFIYGVYAVLHLAMFLITCSDGCDVFYGARGCSDADYWVSEGLRCFCFLGTIGVTTTRVLSYLRIEDRCCGDADVVTRWLRDSCCDGDRTGCDLNYDCDVGYVKLNKVWGICRPFGRKSDVLEPLSNASYVSKSFWTCLALDWDERGGLFLCFVWGMYMVFL